MRRPIDEDSDGIRVGIIDAHDSQSVPGINRAVGEGDARCFQAETTVIRVREGDAFFQQVRRELGAEDVRALLGEETVCMLMQDTQDWFHIRSQGRVSLARLTRQETNGRTVGLGGRRTGRSRTRRKFDKSTGGLRRKDTLLNIYAHFEAFRRRVTLI